MQPHARCMANPKPHSARRRLTGSPFACPLVGSRQRSKRIPGLATSLARHSVRGGRPAIVGPGRPAWRCQTHFPTAAQSCCRGKAAGVRRLSPAADMPLHMLWPARASTCAGKSRPSALAVFILMTSSYLVGACTGRSAGFSPLRTDRPASRP